MYHDQSAWHGLPMRYPLRLKELREKRGLKQSAVAEAYGVSNVTISRYETGDRMPDVDRLPEMARILGVDVQDLYVIPNMLPIGPTLNIKGSVQAGLWKEAVEWPEDDWLTFTGRTDVTTNLEHRFGLRVDGDSMNEIYPHGTIIECVSVMGRAEIVSGKRVVVLRENDRGEFESTVKELRLEADGTQWLVPRSTNPAFQTPIKIGQKEPGIVETRIIAIVVGSYRPE